MNTKGTDIDGSASSAPTSAAIPPHNQQSPNGASIAEALNTLQGYLALDNSYRQSMLSLTASENFPSLLVRLAAASRHGSFYYFPPPYDAADGEWSFPHSGAEKLLSEELSKLALSILHAHKFDWRPNGGSAAEQAPLLAACARGDAYVHFAHGDGGHFALENIAGIAGIETLHIPVEKHTFQIDVSALKKLVHSNSRVRVVILDQSFKLREQPISEIRQALPQEVVLTYDCSHDGALIIGEQMGNPLLQGAHILHGNIHKTIPGPQKGFTSFAEPNHPLVQKVADWVCPRLQSNSHAEQLGAMYLAFKEMEVFGRTYAQQIVNNAKSLAEELKVLGLNVCGEAIGFTRTHQVWILIGSAEDTRILALETLQI